MKTKTTPKTPEIKRNQSSKQGSLLKTKDSLLKKIIAYLRLHHHLNAAFLISKQTVSTERQLHFPPMKKAPVRQFTYTLFIITEKRTPLNPAELMDALYNHTQKQAKVYLISFTEKAVRDKMTFGSNFLKSIFNSVRCIFSVNLWWERYKSYKVNHHPMVIDRINVHWETRFQRANYLHNLTVYNESDQDPAAYFEILQKVIQQTCLGLIYVFWEYKPSYTALPYLLHLCSHFADFPSQIFNTHTYENHHILQQLCHADHLMKFRIHTYLSLKQTDKAWQKCNEFLKMSESLAEQRLQFLDMESLEHVRRVKTKRQSLPVQ
tara:strand:+ start:761 stop:1723 length:963 start_codon:yes stop_codon:yes gene_type:complete